MGAIDCIDFVCMVDEQKGGQVQAKLQRPAPRALAAPIFHVAASFARLPNPAIHSGKTENLDIDSLKTRYAGEHRNYASRTHAGAVCGETSGGKGGFEGGWNFGRLDGGMGVRMRLGGSGQTSSERSAILLQATSSMVLLANPSLC